MNKLKVLLADDNKELITVLSEYISLQEDMEVVEVAGNGNEVLSVLRQRDIDILLLDVVMPDLDGVSVLEELKENPTKTKKNSIPILEKAIQCYWDCTPQEKNDILKSIILKCIYKKEKSGRWNPEAIDNFELDIFFRI